MKSNPFSALFLSVMLITPGMLLVAQGPQAQPPTPAQLLTQDQLTTLVAPIALYPDGLLSQVLAASTYPLEIVELSQWLQRNGNLRGQDLVAAASRQNWDASVQALAVFQEVVNRLNSDIRWTTDLGNAFLAQQADVMNAVQTLRARAKAAGKLESNSYETVTTETQGPQTVYDIQPADPQEVYVPSYNPAYVWGPPDYGYYPPLYYPDFGFSFGYGIPIGGFFGGLGWGGWGWGPNWFGGGIFINTYFCHRYGFNGYWAGGRSWGRGGWAHNPGHRLGVPYPNSRVANTFRGASGGRPNGAGSAMPRQGSLRGMNPGGNQAGVGRASVAPQTQGWQHFGGNVQGNRAPSSVSRGVQSYRSAPSYGGTRSMPSYRPAPSYGGGAYRQSPSFGGGRGMPSYRSSPSFGGGGFGGGRSAPSFPSSPSYGGGGSRGSSSGGFHGGGGGSRGGGGSHSRR